MLRLTILHEPGGILVSAAILSKIDYLIAAKLGVEAELDFVAGVLSGAVTLKPFTLLPADA